MSVAAPMGSNDSLSEGRSPDVVMMSGRLFLALCAGAAGGLWLVSRGAPLPVWLLGAEVLLTILSLFLFGSFKYQIHKNAITYGMLLVIVATFCGLETSAWHVEVAEHGWTAWIREHLLTFEGLDALVHADTMLFILGLTFFVSVFAQTRILENITFALLRRNRGAILPTIIAVTAVVAVASGIFDGVSMIGLTIRTLVILLLLGAAPAAEARYAVMVCTVVTTVCGVWLAYGEPPNLIMRANLFPLLDDVFFLRYCAPAAVAAYAVIYWQLRRTIGPRHVNLEAMDVIDANVADVRFLQAMRHGEVLSPVQLIYDHADQIGPATGFVLARLRGGESLGIALVHERVAPEVRVQLLGHFVSEDLAEALDAHYVFDAAGDHQAALQAEQSVDRAILKLAMQRRNAQRLGTLAVLPFAVLLVVHGVNHHVPLFLASFAGFLAALPGIYGIPRMRALALREARHEYAEYYFLFPLFLSIALLTNSGFFSRLQSLIHSGVDSLGTGHVAVAQFIGATVLSAILDNNIVADFASRALHGLELSVMHIFAMAQIAGYAAGGCWTHIGSAQSVVAFAFIKREVDEQFTPVDWIRDMTPIVVKLMIVLTTLIYAESWLLDWLA